MSRADSLTGRRKTVPCEAKVPKKPSDHFGGSGREAVRHRFAVRNRSKSFVFGGRAGIAPFLRSEMITVFFLHMIDWCTR